MGQDSTVDRLRSSPSLGLSGWRLDAVVSVFFVLLVGGLIADARAHAAGISFAEEGFLTPEHAFFYSAFLGIAGVLFAATYDERRRGASWLAAVPPGYRLGLLGVVLFGVGGAADFAWHSAFGFEESFEALVSPSHLTLGVGSALFLSSPLRAAWGRDGDVSGVRFLPILVATCLLLTVLSLFGGFLNPMVRPYPHYEWASMQRTVGMLIVYPVALVSAVVTLSRRFTLPPGAVAVLFGVPTLALTAVEGHYVLALPAFVAGLVGDALVAWRPPSPDDRRALATFAAVVPAVLAATYFVVVEARYGITHRQVAPNLHLWSVHVLAGTVALAAAGGLLLTLLLAPSARGAEP